jgi:hypothetical protein
LLRNVVYEEVDEAQEREEEEVVKDVQDGDLQ